MEKSVIESMRDKITRECGEDSFNLRFFEKVLDDFTPETIQQIPFSAFTQGLSIKYHKKIKDAVEYFSTGDDAIFEKRYVLFRKDGDSYFTQGDMDKLKEGKPLINPIMGTVIKNPSKKILMFYRGTDLLVELLQERRCASTNLPRNCCYFV